MKPVNLNQARKTRDRAEKKAKADQNAVRFGQTKAERLLATAKQEHSRNRLDQLKFEDD